MLVDIGGTIINTTQVRSIETEPAASFGPPKLTITWSDGSKTETIGVLENVEAACGHMVPAPLGYFEIKAFFHEGEVYFHDPIPVVAFRVAGPGSSDVRAITIEGDPSLLEAGQEARALVFPDGRCFEGGQGSSLPMSLDDWKAEVTERLLRREARA